MQPWSDSPVHSEFTINFFLDTNLLAYLVDRTYPSLNDFVAVVNGSPFARLTSSNYVIFEFVGVRKREHYLRIAVDRSDKTAGQEVNFSSLIKNKDSYNHPSAPFEDVVEEIKNRVNKDLEEIATDFSIDFEYSVLHEGQLKPTIDVCLTSKISNHDSLVLVSSVLTRDQENQDAILLSNDGAFVSSSNVESVKNVLSLSSITPPEVCGVSDLMGLKLVGKETTPKQEIEEKVTGVLLDLICKKLGQSYLGKTFTPGGDGFPDDCICFKVKEGTVLSNNIYISVLSKDLSFIYTSKRSVVFWSNGVQIQEGFTATSANNNISCRLIEVDDEGKGVKISDEVIVALRVNGNLVFIHPDSN